MAFGWSKRAVRTQRDINREVGSLLDDPNVPQLIHQLMPTLVKAEERVGPRESGNFSFQAGPMEGPRTSTGEPVEMWHLASEGVITAGEECLASRIAMPQSGSAGWVVQRMICCGTEGAPSADNCSCSTLGTLCAIDLNIQGVYQHIPGANNVNWPNSCLGATAPDPYDVHPCGNCLGWNGVWKLYQQTGTDPDPCVYGVENLGSEVEDFLDLKRIVFPCSAVASDSAAKGTLSCHPNDKSDAKFAVTLRREGCDMMTFWFEKVSVDPAQTYNETDRTNRVTQISFDTNCMCIHDALVSGNGRSATSGTFDPTTSTPNLQHGTGTACANYSISATGFHDFGDGPEYMTSGNIVVYEPLFDRWLQMEASTAQFAPCEFGGDDGTDAYKFIDEAGCDWTDAIRAGTIWLDFELC